MGGWLDHRLGLGDTIVEAAEHPVPRSSASWWYVFGSAIFTVMILQFVTGLCLATVYAPSGTHQFSQSNGEQTDGSH